jgi:predicted esterase
MELAAWWGGPLGTEAKELSMTAMPRAGWAGRAIRLTIALSVGLFSGSVTWADIATLKNGMTVDGLWSPIGSLSADPTKAILQGQVPSKRIVVFDNQLTRTYFGTNQLAKEFTPSPPIRAETIKIDQKVATSGLKLFSVGSPIRTDPFDEWGRRIVIMRSDRGPLDVVQGITEITPTWTKLEAIQGTNSYIWDMRIATSSIPREQLSRILYKAGDPQNPDQRLRVVRLYLQAERFQDARAELVQLIKDFPNLSHYNEQVKALHQQSALRLLKEVELRRAAGQERLATAMLEQFPADGVAGETLLRVREMLDEIKAQKKQGEKTLALLKQHVAELKDDGAREGVAPIIAEITRDLNANTLDRMADYLRLADDAKIAAEGKVSLAISGWLLGSGAAVENLAVSQSLVKIRKLVQQYLVSTRQPDRDDLLAQLTSLEGATPDYLAKIIGHMRPPLEAATIGRGQPSPSDPSPALAPPPDRAKQPALAPPPDRAKQPAAEKAEAAKIAPPATESGSDCAPKDDSNILSGAPQPAASGLPKAKAAPQPKAEDNVVSPSPADSSPPELQPAPDMGIPGLYELTVKGLPEEPQIKFWVLLPPEYDSYRRYPCLVTLNGGATTPLQQIAWWAGDYSPEARTRYGQATRHGYILIAPQWTREHQRKYEYSAREHAAVLLTLRDACKRFSIDVDRVFLSGHSIGGDAAWDIGLAHPDLWAGVLPIVAIADKYVNLYWENGRYVPMYFVSGEKDGNKRALNATNWDRYLTHSGYDAMIVEFQGRGHEHFHDEIQNLFNWMNVHKRDFFPKEFTVKSLRPWDNFFWWVETDKPNANAMILPAAWGAVPRPAKTEASVNAVNGISVSSACEKLTVWLSPDLIVFDASLKVRLNRREQKNIQPSASTLLEDVRTRGDRQHPFWAKVEN